MIHYLTGNLFLNGNQVNSSNHRKIGEQFPEGYGHPTEDNSLNQASSKDKIAMNGSCETSGKDKQCMKEGLVCETQTKR